MTPKAAPTTLEVSEVGGGFAQDLSELSGASLLTCYQCTKCSAGCTVAGRSDLRPHELVRLIHLGQRETVLSSRFIWECTSCHTCVTRCPQQVDICALNDTLRMLSLREGLAASGTAVPVFNRAFLDSARRRGRVHELGLMAVFKLRTGRLMGDMDKAPAMLAKGKLPLFGKSVSGRRDRERLFARAARKRRAAGEEK